VVTVPVGKEIPHLFRANLVLWIAGLGTQETSIIVLFVATRGVRISTQISIFGPVFGASA
jgi:hypothetical protein